MVESDRNTVQEFINDMVFETSKTDALSVIENNNETTTVSRLGKAKPVVATMVI